MEELNVEEGDTLKAVIYQLICDSNLPPNVQLLKAKVKRFDGETKTISKLVLALT